MEQELHLHQFDTLPQPGDIALVRGAGFSSRLLVILQRLLGRHGDFSHVLICIGADLWCQAMPFKGVDVVTTAKAFLGEEGRPVAVEVLRPPAPVAKLFVPPQVGADDQLTRKTMETFAGVAFLANEWSAWLAVTMYFVGQNYNYRLLLRKWYFDRSKFCSELVAGVMAARNNAPFVGRPHTAFAPNDLRWENLRDHGWSKFTLQFEAYLASEGLPPATKQAEQDAMTKRSFVGLTESTTGLAETLVWSVQRQIETLKVSRLYPGSKAFEPGLLHSLEQRVGQARKLLNELRTVGVLHRGAPWIDGQESYRRRAKAERDLKNAIREGEAFLGRCENLVRTGEGHGGQGVTTTELP